MSHEASPDFDCVIVGAGLTGMYQLVKLRELGLSVKVFEAASDVGGTWFWNRYPGCTLDSESFTYGYSFANDMLQDWRWSKRYASQPEVLSYFQEFARRYDVRKDVEFDTRITRMEYSPEADTWTVHREPGEPVTARFVILAVGILSAPFTPNIPGLETFKGEMYNTSRWPRDASGPGGDPSISMDGKRVGVIGTGSTGIQIVQAASKVAGELVVFQRDANWTLPLGNEDISAEAFEDLRQRYSEIFETCRQSPGGFFTLPSMTSALDVSEEERLAQFERLYNEPGFGLWLGNYFDVLAPGEANQMVADFVANKIRQRVKDPEVAEKLIPKDHAFGSRRIPLETGYLEAYNQPNVRLVDLNETPIVEVNETGIRLSDGQVELDMIVMATGFEAVRGAVDRIEIIGRDGARLKDKWSDRPVTYLGMQTAGFPNLFFQFGPNHGATFCNIPRCMEHSVEWLADLFRYIAEHGVKRIETTTEAEEAWTDQVLEDAAPSLFMTTDSFITGSNLPGRKRSFLFYASGNPAYREVCGEVEREGYRGFEMTKAPEPANA